MENRNIVGRSIGRQVLSFLCCMLNDDKPIAMLRGHSDIIRMIWTLVCEEWWDLHIERFPMCDDDSVMRIFELPQDWRDTLPIDATHQLLYPVQRKRFAGCPVASIGKNLSFPAPQSIPLNTFKGQTDNSLYVNMMPFDLRSVDSLPDCCRGYWSLISACFPLLDTTNARQRIGYLTIDERPVQAGHCQRRRGLHVESPGVMPLIKQHPHEDLSASPFLIESSKGNFVPGAEHHWGNGLMMRGERFDGGIFMASNMADTTAVWNCRINDEDGDFIGAHGDIERFRDLLGPCARTLEAGELIWMTDRTPHESLPIPASAGSQRRQYFRLVVGQVSAWFADHSTPNPLGTVPPPGVRFVRGDKFTLYPPVRYTWNAGTTDTIAQAYDFQKVRLLLVKNCLGHLTHRMYSYGARSLSDCKRLSVLCGPYIRGWTAKYSLDGRNLSDENDYGARYFEMPMFEQFLTEVNVALDAETRRLSSLQRQHGQLSITKRMKNWFGL